MTEKIIDPSICLGFIHIILVKMRTAEFERLKWKISSYYRVSEVIIHEEHLQQLSQHTVWVGPSYKFRQKPEKSTTNQSFIELN